MTVGMRIGQGFDVHALVAGRRLVLGGVEIAFDRGLEGHSDADVLLHAVIDALLGAAALGDIGRHFPDSDARYRGVDSRALLREVRDDARTRAVAAVATSMRPSIAQAPRLAPHVDAMAANIAADLGLAARASTSRRRPPRGLASPAAARASPRWRSR